jgi:CelD/BcsL family acetyltransferase involved in cellulose biosynthesis
MALARDEKGGEDPAVDQEAGVFSSEPFLCALNAAHFAGRGRIGYVRVGPHVVRTLIDGDRPVLDAALLDFFVPVAGVEPEAHGRYAPRIATSLHAAEDAHAIDTLVTEHAPLVCWEPFSSWDDVLELWRSRENGIVRESRRRARRLERELGPVRFAFDDARDESVRACLAWKSAQFRSSGLPDPFDDPRETRLLLALLDDGIARLSSLHAGDRLVAAHIGLEWGNAMHWWLPSFDRSVGWASPGRLLLEWVMQQSYERGHERFDFLRGGAAYKWNYVTAYRAVEEVGRPPLRRRARLARARAVRRYPRLATAARTARDVAKSKVR